MQSCGRIVLSVAALLLLASTGCDRNIAPYDPTEQPSQPDLRQIFPAPERPRGAQPMMAGAEPVMGTSSGRPGAAVRGNIRLAEGIEPTRGAVLFVIARRRGAVGGPPLAVMRVANPEFPQAFELGPDQVMIPSLTFEGPLSVSARLDADGNAMTRSPDDPTTVSDTAAVPGDMELELRLELGGAGS